MHFQTLATAALLSMAQAAKVQVVSVGFNPMTLEAGTGFWPSKIDAKPGSMVQFQFWAGNHTVTQSNFDNACVPISQVNESIVGIDSDFQPADASADSGAISLFTVMINDTSPLWFFCKPHCAAGMSMVVNEDTVANATRSLEEYQVLAAASGDVETPISGGGAGGDASGDGTEETPETGIPADADGAEGAGPGQGGGAAALAAPWTLLLAIGSAFLFL